MNTNFCTSYSPNFQAGLTSNMKQEIKFADVNKISKYFESQGIENNFKSNKVIAWCSLKCLKILQEMTKRFNLNLGFPKGIFVENFNDLQAINKSSLAFANFAPTKVYKNKDIITSEKTIFFNNFENPKIWETIDEIADENYAEGLSPTDFFLETFLHEFMHVIHECHLMNKLGGQKLGTLLLNNPKTDCITKFQTKYGNSLKQICDYAITNPMEAVACDLSKRAINNLNKEQLVPVNNFIKSSPYDKTGILTDLYANLFIKNRTDKILKKCWDGKIN